MRSCGIVRLSQKDPNNAFLIQNKTRHAGQIVAPSNLLHDDNSVDKEIPKILRDFETTIELKDRDQQDRNYPSQKNSVKRAGSADADHGCTEVRDASQIREVGSDERAHRS